MGMMTVFWEPNCWAISCRPRFPASLTWATVLCQRLLPGYSSTSAQVNLEVAEYALSPTYPLMCWIYRQIKRKEGVISGRISETPRYIYIDIDIDIDIHLNILLADDLGTSDSITIYAFATFSLGSSATVLTIAQRGAFCTDKPVMHLPGSRGAGWLRHFKQRASWTEMSFHFDALFCCAWCAPLLFTCKGSLRTLKVGRPSLLNWKRFCELWPRLRTHVPKSSQFHLLSV